MSQPTVLSLVNKLKIDQDKAKDLIEQGQNLIDRGRQHLDEAHATLVELAVIQGITTKPLEEKDVISPYPPKMAMNEAYGTGPERIMS
jgi:hypothetical protein